MLKVNNLTVSVTCNKITGKKIDEKPLKILNNISFKVDEGEILGLAGESGCGKSMTALSIAGLLPPEINITEGEIIYNDLNLTALSDKEFCGARSSASGIRGSEISVIFQDVRQALNPSMKIGKQITETLELGVSRDKIKNKTAAVEMLSVLGFTDPEKILNAYPHQLSGGMCQRIMTAIAVIRRPKLLLGDEPSSSLDEESQKQCLSLLLELNRNHKMTLIIISHDLSKIQKFCTRFLIMYSGRIVEEGPARALFSPLHPYTRALVNALPGREKRGKKLDNIPGKVPSVEDQLPGCPFAPRCSKAQGICSETFPPEYFYRKDKKGANERKVYCYFPVEADINTYVHDGS